MDSDLILALVGFVLGVISGAGIAFFVRHQSDKQRTRHEEKLVQTLKDQFSSLSTDALDKTQERFLQLANQRLETQTEKHSSALDTKKELIDSQLKQVSEKLEQVGKLVGDFEAARETKLGALGQQLDNLTRTANLLQQTFSNSQERGQWGQRVAEDILMLLGFEENVNYRTQATTSSGKRPDFTFSLPNGLSLNMDVKTPFSHYMSYVEAESETDKQVHVKQFLDAVKRDIKDIVDRDYINEETVELVLMFIPSEQVFRFIHEQDNSIIDTALRSRVVLCSPLTLYVVLAVMRQAATNFNLERRSREILKIFSEIKQEWEKYNKSMTRLRGNLDTAMRTFEELDGTRQRQLNNRFVKVDRLLEDPEVTGLLEDQAAD